MRSLRQTVLVFLAGTIFGGILVFFAGSSSLNFIGERPAAVEATPVCYSCLWEGYDSKLHSDLVEFYRQYKTRDPIVEGDVRYILWRATSAPNCDARTGYRDAASSERDPARRYVEYAIVGFSGPECGRDSTPSLKRAADAAEASGLKTEAKILRASAAGDLAPRFPETDIRSSLTIPPGAKSMILGETAVHVGPGTKVGAQVDRVVRDWISYQLKWDMSHSPTAEQVLQYHEGAVVRRILDAVPAQVIPLTGAIAARRPDGWFAADDNGDFRFQLLDDKLKYPTTHIRGQLAWIEDTHGISALVPQAIERGVNVVIGCGDAEGKAKAAYYLAQRGIDVVFPGDRYGYMLLGYEGTGTLIGGAPVKKQGDGVIIGGQPVRFSLAETYVVEDTKKPFPIQYYDSAARYFERLGQSVPLRVEAVTVDAADQIDRVLKRAADVHASAIGVRIFTEGEDKQLRAWLKDSPKRRAILFHSGLYPYAQKLFEDFPQQVTFGDLHPRFE